jgi:hypothetical protein
MKPCISCLLEVNGKGIRGMGGVSDKKVYTVKSQYNEIVRVAKFYSL